MSSDTREATARAITVPCGRLDQREQEMDEKVEHPYVHQQRQGLHQRMDYTDIQDSLERDFAEEVKKSCVNTHVATL